MTHACVPLKAGNGSLPRYTVAEMKGNIRFGIYAWANPSL
jgi:hypothetical protein